MKHYNDWTKKELLDLRGREWKEDVGEFDSLIIIPSDELHESGFRCMDFVAVKGDEPICRLSAWSDVISIDGIGGYGEWNGNLPDSVAVKGWSIDCLKESGLLRLFCNRKLKAGESLSSLEIFGR